MLGNDKKITEIELCKLKPFSNHPFRVDKESEDFKQLMESIKEIGVSTPITVRKSKDGFYEIISGHRRSTACSELGLKTVPAVMVEMTDDQAVLAMVDSNIQRENILPSEKAFAYKMKLDVMKADTLMKKVKPYGFGSGQLVQATSVERVGEEVGESYKQVQRYIRLTHLEKKLLQMVDDKKIAFIAGVELSYLNNQEQIEVIKKIESSGKYPSLVQAKRIRKLSSEGNLSALTLEGFFNDKQPKAKTVNPYSKEFILQFFPKGYSDLQVTEILNELLGNWKALNS